VDDPEEMRNNTEQQSKEIKQDLVDLINPLIDFNDLTAMRNI